ncbi:MAG: glycosyltransferase [Myxococcota bacterium]
MARLLFVVPPLVGHVNPTVAVASALRARGHDVAWVAHPTAVRPLLPAGAELLPLPDEGHAEVAARAAAEGSAVRGLASIQFFLERFLVPLAHHMVPGVRDAVDAWRPDALIVDQQALAGAIVARERGLPWATSATTSAELVDPLASFPKVAAWRTGLLRDLQAAHGLDPVDEPGWSPHLVLVFSTPALVGPGPWPPHWAFVGPAVAGRSPGGPFPWDALEDRPRVLVSLGTVSTTRQRRFYDVVAEAVQGAPWQTIVSAPQEMLPEPPAGVLRFDRVPQLALLPHLHAVVTHGGHNTVCEALSHGLPLVVTPIRDDQPVVAHQVVQAGAGLRLSFGRLRPAELRDALRRVLDDPSHREAAARVAESFRAAGGADAAALRVEALG